MRLIRRDVQFSLRLLKNSPGFTLVAVFTLALGIAINTTVFSWIETVLLHPFQGVGHGDRLALIETVTSGGEHLVNTSYIDYRDYRERLKLIEGLGIGRFTPLSVGPEGKSERAWAELVSANYFDVLQVKPVLGRTFLPEEDANRPGAFPVAVISYNMWRNRYRQDPKVLGRTIRLNRQDLTIVGVAPKEFHGSLVGVVFDLWAPITMAKAMGTGNGTLSYRATRDITSTIARLKPGVTVEQAGAEAAAVAKRLAEAHPDTNRGIDAIVVPVWAGHLGAQNMLLKPLRILMAVSLLLLLIVCANVANLLLSRAVARQREFAIRLALGADRGRLARQLLTETLLLAAAGAAAGVILVMWMGQGLVSLLPRLDVSLDFGGGLNFYTLGFTLLLAVAATLVAGIVPALISTRTNLDAALKESGRSGGFGTRSHRWRGVLVLTQVALAMVALTGAGLFYRSFRNASGIYPGFDTNNVSVSGFYLTSAGYSGVEQHKFCRDLRQRMERIPGVLGVTYSDVVPLAFAAGSAPWHQLKIEGYVPAPNEQMYIHRATIPPDYLRFMGIKLLEGRDFTERDDEQAPKVIIVNETFARRYFRGADPIGRKITMEGNPVTIVGLAKDSKYHVATEAPLPFFYIPFRQWFWPGLNFSVFMRTAGDPLRMTHVLRREALALNPDANFNTQLMSEAITVSLYPQKVAASLLGVTGIVCVLLAAVGLYSVMSYAVSQRTQELGVRMALGAEPRNVQGLVVRDGMLLAAPGVLVGMAAVIIAARPFSGMLVRVSAMDPATLAAAAVFLSAVAFLASYIPALRATRVDPITVLRCQ